MPERKHNINLNRLYIETIDNYSPDIRIIFYCICRSIIRNEKLLIAVVFVMNIFQSFKIHKWQTIVQTIEQNTTIVVQQNNRVRPFLLITLSMNAIK